MLSIPDKFKVTLLQANTKKTSFKNQQIKKIHMIFHNINCASSYAIYVIECILSNKQYVGKAETSFNIRLNNHRENVKKVDTMVVCKDFQQENQNFNMQNLPLLIS